MKHHKLRSHPRSFCPKCSIKFQKRRLTCPFCRTLIMGSLPVIILFVLGIVAVLFTILNADYF